jgi:hypothetical protein
MSYAFPSVNSPTGIVAKDHSIEVHGIQFHVGDIVSSDIANFWRIKGIVTENGGCFLILRSMKIVEYTQQTLTFRLIDSTSVRKVSVSTLFGCWPLVAADDGDTVVVLHRFLSTLFTQCKYLCN